MPNLSSLAPITTSATALSNLVLVSPQQTIGYQPQNAKGSTAKQPPALVFNYEGEQTVSLESDITDHYVEDNTAIQDQVALRPEIITTHGFIGELNDVVPSALKPLNALAEKLTVISAYTPVLSETAILAYNEAFFLYQVAASVLNSGVSSWASINGTGGENVVDSNGLQTGVFDATTGQISNNQSKQQIAFQQFYGYWRARTLFTVQTPWAVFQNMAIVSLRAIQDAETRVITDFEVRFKMIRFSNTLSSPNVAPILQGRASTQAAPVVDFGTQTPAPSIDQSAAFTSAGVA